VAFSQISNNICTAVYLSLFFSKFELKIISVNPFQMSIPKISLLLFLVIQSFVIREFYCNGIL